MERSTVCAVFGVIVFAVTACGQTGVRPVTRSRDTNLPRPSRILVYDFAVSEAEVKEAQGALRQQPTIKDPVQRERKIGQQVADALALDLVAGLQRLGFAVERVERGTMVTGNDLLVDGQFLNVDEGDRLRRVVIGFGSGASTVDTRVQVYQAPEGAQLLDFRTHSDSGIMPGAATTMGAGAAVSGGVTAGVALGSAVMSGVRVYRSEVERMAGASADQTVRYLSEFFVKQAWIRPDQVKKARMAY
jgi:hypothetical protein